MKITPNTPNLPVNTVGTARDANGTQPGASSAEKSPVALSSAARHLASLQNGSDDVDLERIQQIRDAIAAGQLKVDTGRIADSLLASARELLK